MKKRGIRICLWILGILIVTGSGMLFWQRENVLAAWEAVRYTEEELGGQIVESKEEVENALKVYNLEGIRDFTLEEEDAIRKGELSVEEAVARIMAPVRLQGLPKGEVAEGVASTVISDEAVTPIGDTEEVVPEEVSAMSVDPQAEVDQIVAEAVSKMYALKGKYLGLLGGVESRAKRAFFALPQSERNIKGLQKIGGPLISEAIGLESQCNGEVAAVLNQLKADLKVRDADTTIVETMQQSYETEKRLKKAYYLSAFK